MNVSPIVVSYGNHGCNGGNMYNAYAYVVANNGVDSQSSYPFQGRVCSTHLEKKRRGGHKTIQCYL